ncbi:MAG: sensor histidine kinase [Eubacteriales bacterium]|nr:sensor histidine kinase [Eubacteriales bacterium]
MKLKMYLKDQLIKILLFISFVFITWSLLYGFRCPFELIVAEIIMAVLFMISGFLWDYFRKKTFYDELILNTDRMDKKYLVLETLKCPSFYEGKLIYEQMYEIDKSMTEHVKMYERKELDFREFTEMWVHEIKLPISSLALMCHNDRDVIDKKYIRQINRLDDYADRILYYVRAENAEADYLFSDISLKSVVNKAALKNKDMLLESDIEFKVHDVDTCVKTDGKWLEFIINQIVSNSIKYMKDDREGVKSGIEIYSTAGENEVSLHIRDNGIGIPSGDITRVFNKSFTGVNGRKSAKSTGMGLYIVKGLCDRMGHRIIIESERDVYTEVTITFYADKFYEPVN